MWLNESRWLSFFRQWLGRRQRRQQQQQSRPYKVFFFKDGERQRQRREMREGEEDGCLPAPKKTVNMALNHVTTERERRRARWEDERREWHTHDWLTFVCFCCLPACVCVRLWGMKRWGGVDLVEEWRRKKEWKGKKRYCIQYHNTAYAYVSNQFCIISLFKSVFVCLFLLFNLSWWSWQSCLIVSCNYSQHAFPHADCLSLCLVNVCVLIPIYIYKNK